MSRSSLVQITPDRSQTELSRAEREWFHSTRVDQPVTAPVYFSVPFRSSLFSAFVCSRIHRKPTLVSFQHSIPHRMNLSNISQSENQIENPRNFCVSVSSAIETGVQKQKWGVQLTIHHGIYNKVDRDWHRTHCLNYVAFRHLRISYHFQQWRTRQQKTQQLSCNQCKWLLC